jgi:hypothetical protein
MNTAPHSSRWLLFISALFIIGLSGCGGDAGGGGNQTGANTPHLLGQRAVPGGSIRVSGTTAVTVGSSSTFHLVLSGFAQLPRSVQARTGKAYDDAVPMVSATPSGDGYALVLPVTDAAGCVWVRLEFADGSVIESGASDFPLG